MVVSAISFLLLTPLPPKKTCQTFGFTTRFIQKKNIWNKNYVFSPGIKKKTFGPLGFKEKQKKMNLWQLTGARWPLSRKFLVADVGFEALTLPSTELVRRLKQSGGVGLIAATQPAGVQAVLFEDGVDLYAKYCARPSQFWIYFECASGWCRVVSPTWDRRVPTQRVPVMSLSKPRRQLFIGPICPSDEAVDRVGATSLRVMAMLYLTEIYMKGRVLYWSDVQLPKLGEVDLSTVENYFDDLPAHRPLLLTVNFGAVLVGSDDVVRYFDPVVDKNAMRVIDWHARRAGLDFVQVNEKPRPLEDAYWFVAGKVVEPLMDLARFCLQARAEAKSTALEPLQQPSESLLEELLGETPERLSEELLEEPQEEFLERSLEELLQGPLQELWKPFGPHREQAE